MTQADRCVLGAGDDITGFGAGMGCLSLPLLVRAELSQSFQSDDGDFL